MLWSKRNSLLNWPDSTGNAPRNTKNKKEAPEKLEESSRGRNRTHRRAVGIQTNEARAQDQKKSKQDKLDRKANLKQAKKRSLKSGKRKGKATMAEWLNGGISSRADREENPDRDKN
jgi:hypothetical protein